MDLSTLSIKKAHDDLVGKKLTVKELADAYVANIKEKDGELGAYLEVFDDIEEQAARAQKMIDDGKASELTGIPMAVKDNILIQGRKVTAASEILEGYVSSYDATVIKKLKAEGVVFLGRTNMDEFAMGSSTETSAYKVTKNPHDHSRVPGGSSGGSAVATAACLALVSLGSDTGGSIRQPAGFCGCIGLKPTYGAVSRYGLIAMGSSLDQIGPLSKSVADAEAVFKVIAGEDEKDSTTVRDAERGKENKEKKVLGVPWHLINREGVDEKVIENFRQTVTELEQRGYTTKEIELLNLDYALAAYYVLMPAEVSSNLARFDGVKYGLRSEGESLMDVYMNTRSHFGREARTRSMVGTYVLSSGYYDAYYNKAHTARRAISDDFRSAFEGEDGVDAVITPTTPTPAFKVGEKVDDPLAMYMADIFTVPANIAGVPSISVPSGTVTEEDSELPVGLQITAPWLGEERLFSIARTFLKEE